MENEMINTYVKNSANNFVIFLDETLCHQYHHFLLSISNQFESKKWKMKNFKNFIITNLKECALTEQERQSLAGNEGEILDKAISKLRINERSGEIGEIFLHGIMREYYNALPIVPKIFYKQNRNVEALGFDSAHLTIENQECHLWLGESKLYDNLDDAIRNAIKSLKDHLSDDEIMRNEARIIANSHELDNLGKHHNIQTRTLANFKQIVNGNINLDELKSILHVPISIIYNCDHTKNIEEITDDYKTTIKNFHKEKGNEISEEIKKLSNKITYIDRIKFHIILFPVPDKKEIMSKINKIFESYRNAD
ncbi:DUF1837 domain-containing protein [uncultured Helicobacter sp.]|uniref:HamA C-terminal domain-containing protein n=1 Tax=uncultured Helicobacter sp. TaxID=175537 RepID=UPI0037530FC8